MYGWQFLPKLQVCKFKQKAMPVNPILIINYVKSIFDYASIICGIAILFLSICFPMNELYKVFGQILGIVGFVYIIYELYYIIFRRIDFDWELTKGRFLRKVICIVVLLPFSLTVLLSGLSNHDNSTPGRYSICSPKELVYDENLYANGDDISTDIRQKQESPNLLWAVYFHFMDPGNQHMTTSTVGRGWAALFAILGVFLLNGLLISILTNWFDKRQEHWSRGEIRYAQYNFRKGRYAVIIGANEIVASVIKNLLNRTTEKINFKCEGNNDYIILQTSKEAIEVREELSSHLTEDQLRRIVIYNAMRDSKAELELLFLNNATEIYVLGESTATSKDEGETYHDAMNMKCVNLIAACMEEYRKKQYKSNHPDELPIHRKVCKVMFEYQTTYSIFQFADLPDIVKNNIIFIPFNRYESWAQRVLVEGFFENPESHPKVIGYTPLDGNGISPDSDEYVHFIIVGMSNMGIAMGVQAILQAHYLNYKKARSRITFIDTEADKEMAFFKGRYETLFELTRHKYIDANQCEPCQLEASFGWTDPAEQENYKWSHLSTDGKNFIDIELEFIKGSVESEGVRTYLQKIAADTKSKLTIAICLMQTHRAVAASLYMPIDIYKKVQEIWVYQREASDIISNLTNTKEADKRYKKLRPFGMLYGEYMRDRSQYLKALLANGAYELSNVTDRNMADKSTYKDLRDNWKELNIVKKWSNKFFVDSIYQKIRGVLPEIAANNGNEYSYKERLFDSGNVAHLETILREALKKYENILAICEHNRWNVQQLLMGFSPCDKSNDAACHILNEKHKSKKEQLDKCDKSSPAYEHLKIAEKEAKDKFKTEKDRLKISEDRIHPNICDFDHLDHVDSQAKNYDKYLNNSIPAIIILVDGYDKGIKLSHYN